MKAQHTPGPWVALPEEPDKPYIRIRAGLIGSRYKIANVLTPKYDGSSERELAETRANARLIAAAPETFECLLGIVQAMERGEIMVCDMTSRKNQEASNYLIIESRAVVAKAQGGAE